MISAFLILLLSLFPVLAGVVDAADEAKDLARGVLVFDFEPREGVEGNDHSLRFFEDGFGTERMVLNGHRVTDDEFQTGNVAVSCRIRHGRITGLEYSVPGEAGRRPQADRDLGTLSPRAAADFFLELARGPDEELAEDAVLGAALVRGTDAEGELLDLARDRNVTRGGREQTLFWLAVLAGRRSVATIQHVIDDSGEDAELRTQAVFALSRLDEEIAFPALMEIARTHPQPEVRSAAFIWIAEYDRPEVVNLFEEILVDN